MAAKAWTFHFFFLVESICSCKTKEEKEMAKTSCSLLHTEWMCKYHIIFTPQVSQKNHLLQNKTRSHWDLLSSMSIQRCGNYWETYDTRSCSYACLDPSKTYDFWFHGVFDKYVSIVGLDGKAVAKYVREQEKNGIVLERLSAKAFLDGDFRTR